MNTLYRDSLLEITDRDLVFHRYYCFGGEKSVALDRIERVQVRPPSIWFGSWRIWGGGPRTFFPLDWRRPSRDAIFVAVLLDRFLRIGFTVQDSKRVKQVFKDLGILLEAL